MDVFDVYVLLNTVKAGELSWLSIQKIYRSNNFVSKNKQLMFHWIHTQFCLYFFQYFHFSSKKWPTHKILFHLFIAPITIPWFLMSLFIFLFPLMFLPMNFFNFMFNMRTRSLIFLQLPNYNVVLVFFFFIYTNSEEKSITLNAI